MRLWNILVMVGALCFSVPAFAWGEEGHHIVCQIAYEKLTDKSRTEVDRLLSSAPTAKYRRFSTACLFADAWRNDHKDNKVLGRNDDHYLNLKRTDRSFSGDGCGITTNCVVKAVRDDLGILSNKTQSDKLRRIALTFLGHWVGDLHQPLHVAFKNDGGGNGIPVTGACDAQRIDNLHSVWDTCIIRSQIYVSTVKKSSIITDPLFDKAVDDLIAGVTPEISAKSKTGTPSDWADESFGISISASTHYCADKIVSGKPTECQPTSVFIINADYLKNNAVIERERLQLAGLRLADMLNKALN